MPNVVHLFSVTRFVHSGLAQQTARYVLSRALLPLPFPIAPYHDSVHDYFYP